MALKIVPKWRLKLNETAFPFRSSKQEKTARGEKSLFFLDTFTEI